MKKKSLLLAALLLLVGISSIFVAGTYAKYASTIDGKQGEAVIAKWTFATANEDITMDVDFTTTYDADTLIADRIAPGTSGTFAIELSNAGGETGVDYTITFGTITPTIAGLTLTSGGSAIPAAGLTGTIAPNGSDTVTINWEWAYEGNDSQDTTLGEAGGASGTKLVVPVTITGVQTQPSA